MTDDYTTKILTTLLIHFSLKGRQNVLFELGSERVNNRQIVFSTAAN